MNSLPPQTLTLSERVLLLLENRRNILLEGLQYVCLFVAWYYETEWEPKKTEQFFLLYKRVFKLRRLFRVGVFINFIPLIRETYQKCETKMSAQNVFQLLRFIFKFLFYLVDNVAVVLDVIQFPNYSRFRRASYSILALALVCSFVQYMIRLTHSFNTESSLKTRIVNQQTPKQFMTQLNTLDQQRLRLLLQMFRCLGDLCPALQRTNVTQYVLRTRINKGTVALTGLAAVVLQILRQKMK